MQYIMYAPYGELLLNQQAGTYDERFKFTGKERDEETGYDYHNARYREVYFYEYFLSTDRLLDKFLYNSPYVYGEANPIRYTDPTGLFFNDENEKVAQDLESKIKQQIEVFKSQKTNRMECKISIRQLRKSLSDINSMRKDHKYEYRFTNNTENEGGVEYVGKNDNESPIYNIKFNFEKMDLVIHEVRHGGQIARRAIRYTRKDAQKGYNIYKEVYAYRAQWAWKQQLNLPHVLKNGVPTAENVDYFDINVDYVKSIIKEINIPFEYVYQ